MIAFNTKQFPSSVVLLPYCPRPVSAGKPTPNPHPWGNADPLTDKCQGFGGVEGWWKCGIRCRGAFIGAQWQAASSIVLPNAMRHAWHSTPHKSKESSGLHTYGLTQRYVKHTHTHRVTETTRGKQWVLELRQMSDVWILFPISLLCIILLTVSSFPAYQIITVERACFSSDGIRHAVDTSVGLFIYMLVCLRLAVLFRSLNPPELARWQFAEYKTQSDLICGRAW